MRESLSAGLVWYLRLGPSLPIRALALVVWLCGAAWAGVNILGITLNLIGAQFIKSVEDGRECSIPLWNALPRNAVLDFFPGTTPHGLISTVMILLTNLALFGVIARILAHNPKMLSSAAPGGPSVVHAVLLNVGAVLAIVLILALGIAARVIATVVLSRFNSVAVDLMLPGTCSFLGYP